MAWWGRLGAPALKSYHTHPTQQPSPRPPTLASLATLPQCLICWSRQREEKSLSSVDSLRPHGLQPTRLLHPWDFPGKRTGVGYHCLLQGIFPTQVSSIVGRRFTIWLYHLTHQGRSREEWFYLEPLGSLRGDRRMQPSLDAPRGLSPGGRPSDPSDPSPDHLWAALTPPEAEAGRT